METVLIILMFILGLLILITLHEFGHFIVAKIFDVYCFEFSICFGKKVIRRKKKYAETYFCLGVIPLGGYVSMLGEDADETEKNVKENNKKSKKEIEENTASAVSVNDEKPEEEHLSFTVINRKKYRLFKKQNKLIKKEIEYLNQNKNLGSKNIFAQEALMAKKNITLQEANEIIARDNVKEKLGLENLIVEEDFYSVVDENHLPKERGLENINRGKKFAIMSAGIVMNFIVGFILYLISYSCFPNVAISSRFAALEMPEGASSNLVINLNELNSTLDENHAYALKGNYIMFEDDLWNESFVNKSFTLNRALGTAILKDGEKQINTMAIPNNMFQLSDLSIDTQLYQKDKDKNIYNFYEIVADDSIGETTFKKYKEANIEKLKEHQKVAELFDEMEKEDSKITKFTLVKKIKYQNSVEKPNIDSVEFSIPMVKGIKNDNVDGGLTFDANDLAPKNLTGSTKMDKEKGLLEPTYIGFTAHERWLGVDSFKYAASSWADGTTAVFKAVGNLFIGKGWDSIGGPIAILTQSSMIFKNNPFSVYLRMWGLISVNLAIMNLLPFPGLDGWHLLVTTIEAVTRRKINVKFKNWASRIGLFLLFGLMIAIFLVDIVRCAGVAI